MGWRLAADLPVPPEASDHSITVALIAALSAVVVALIGLVASRRSSNQTSQPSLVDSKLPERVAVTESQVTESKRTLAMLDRHVDGQGDEIDQLRWRVVRVEQHLGLDPPPPSEARWR